MRALVLSDLHDQPDRAANLITQMRNKFGKMDAYIFLGDGAYYLPRITETIRPRDPEAKIYSVKGNNDLLCSDPNTLIIEFGGAKMYLTHGHLLRVKWGLDKLKYAALEANCTIALYGHTHLADVETGVPMCINPGAAEDGRIALLEVEDGKPRVQLLRA